ncbi:MAG: MBL fold metallo-hydrolase [Oscillospiraceae bacterium]|jgi:phosphoribosyl 1,2-cyclic phosphate phosphodiesterase|nr:MBL fold metallo-hydrolase [Oscillospiraceae bacterium]
MKFTIIGSGGCVCLPKPTCRCAVCVEAREKGGRYKRHSASLYLDDAALLVDTPEDIADALNCADIRAVNNVLYTHRDPDHTMGMRVFEQLRLEWLDYYEKIPPRSRVNVYAEPSVMDTINEISIGYGALLGYYEGMGLIEQKPLISPIDINGVVITCVNVSKTKPVSVFVFEGNGKRLIYAPCDCTPFPDSPIFYGADVLVVGNTFVGDILKGGRVIGAEHPLRSELHSIENIFDIKAKFGIGDVIITHIEEDWGKGYDDYTSLEKSYNGIRFAYDGMVIEL